MTAPAASAGSSSQYTADLTALAGTSSNISSLAGQSSSTVADLSKLVLDVLSFAQIGSTVGAANTSLQSSLSQALSKVSSVLQDVGKMIGTSAQGYAAADQTVAKSLGSGAATTPAPAAPQDPAGWKSKYTSPNTHPGVVGKIHTAKGMKPTYDMTGHHPPATAPDGNLTSWISQARSVLQANGTDTSNLNDKDLRTLINGESSSRWNQLNNYDINAQHGIPSKGLMQTTDPTFNQYSVPGHRDIWNPVDNIVAGVRYADQRYGGISQTRGVISVNHGGPYIGY